MYSFGAAVRRTQTLATTTSIASITASTPTTMQGVHFVMIMMCTISQGAWGMMVVSAAAYIVVETNALFSDTANLLCSCVLALSMVRLGMSTLGAR